MNGRHDPAIISFAELVLRPHLPVEIHPLQGYVLMCCSLPLMLQFKSGKSINPNPLPQINLLFPLNLRRIEEYVAQLMPEIGKAMPQWEP